MPDAGSASTESTLVTAPHSLAAHGWRILLIAGSYLTLGLLSAQLAPTADYAVPLWPPAGLALAVVLIAGWRSWPGILLGGVLVELWFHPGIDGLVINLVCAAGVTAQALLGARLVRDVFNRPQPLAREGEILRFLLLAGPVACLLGASVGVLTRVLSGRTEASMAIGEWLVWWGGDALGVMLFAPLFLLMWPSRRRLWGRLRGGEALPLLLIAVVLLIGNVFIGRIELGLAREEALRVKEEAFDVGFHRLPAELEALRGAERLFAASEEVTEDQFTIYTRYIVARPGIVGVDWAPRVTQAERRAHETRWRGILEPGPDNELVPADAQRVDYFPILFRAAHESAGNGVGLDHAALAPQRAAIEQARDSGTARALPPVEMLLHDRRLGVLLFVPVYRAGFNADAASIEQRREALAGMVVGRFGLAELLAPFAQAAASRGLEYRLLDVTPGESPQLLGGTLAADASAGWVRNIDFGGRSWRVELQHAAAPLALGSTLQSRLFMLFSVLMGFMASYATLAAGGRHAATASQVAERTAALQQELRARRNAERALKASEEQLDRFFSLSPDMFCVASTDGQFLRVNPSFSRTLGWSEAELIGQPFLEFVHPEDVAATLQEVERLRQGDSDPQFSNRYRCKDGSWRMLAWRTAPQPDGTIFATARDVSREREIQQKLEEASAAAEQANRAKSAFLATMSHEIRTPMNGVLGTIELLDHSELDERQRDLLDVARQSGIVLLTLIDDILDFSKIEAGRLELNPTPVALTDLVEGVCSTMVPAAEGGGVDLQLFVDPGLPAGVRADESRLRQVLFNLLGNAVKFSGGRPGHRGRVQVRVEPVAGVPSRMRISIVDNGIGISAADAERVFTPFTQAEISTTRRYGGTGLGLAICQRLVELLGGTIALDSAPGKGATFSVELPYEPIAAEDLPVPPELPALDGLDCVLLRDPSLAVDDLGEYLRFAGATVSIRDHAGAVAYCTQREPDMVILLRTIDSAVTLVDDPLSGMPNVRPVLVARDWRRRSDIDPATAVLLDGALIRRRSLLRAVAVAAGRASPESQGPGPAALDVAFAGDGGYAGPGVAPLILVAEDDPINQAVVRQQLAVLGYPAEIVDDGEQALQAWRRGGHALLLTDLHMPKLDGYELASAIRREEPVGRHLPIVALTANALRGEAGRALAAGIDDHLTKPVPLARLGAALQANLALGQGESAAAPAERRAAGRPSTLQLDRMREMIGDDETALRSLLGQFRGASADLSDELAKAMAEGDRLRVGRLAHRFKSASRSIGAVALGDCWARLEDSCATDSGDELAWILDRCNAELAAVQGQIDAYLEQPAEPDEPDERQQGTADANLADR